MTACFARMRRVVRPAARPALLLYCASLLLFAGCGGKGGPVPLVALALDGPPLALAGEYAGLALEGVMERRCMAGYGRLELAAVGREESFACEAKVDAPPTEKGRVRGVLRCTGGRKLAFSLRNVGPDQGVGIAREREEGELMVFFYHASLDEARRRYPSVKQDIARAAARQ